MKIDANGRKIREILERKICYEIPDYQRPYSWTKDQIEDLFNDLDSAVENEKNHFFGAVVFNSERKEKDNVIEVIDGQQRLTTLILVFYAIRRIYSEKCFDKEKGISTRRENIVKLIEFVDDDGETIGVKLKLGETNREFYKQYIVDAWNKDNTEKEKIKKEFRVRNNYKVNKPLVDAYEEIYNIIKRKINGIQPSEAYSILKDYYTGLLDRFEIVEIEVESDVDAFLIFETLNDRGLELSAVDLIKNKLFKNCSDSNEFDEIKTKWIEILGVIDDAKEVKRFIRHYWISKHNFVSPQELYKEVRDYIENSFDKSKEIIYDLYDLSRYYDALKNPNNNVFENNKLIDILEEMKSLKFDLNFPILLAAIRYNVNDEEYIYKVAKLTTNFLFRYICILKKKPTAIEKVFSELARNMNLDSMSKTLNEYAKDIEFRNILETIIVNPKAYSTYYLLTEYEKSLHSNEQWISPGRKKITVEHILPQKVDSKSNYGEKWLKEFANPEQCELYLNRLGNLTLLGPVGQANASNKSFDLKKQVYQKKTDMYMSRELIKYDEWNVKNIEERQKEMSRKIVNIFTLNINDI